MWSLVGLMAGLALAACAGYVFTKSRPWGLWLGLLTIAVGVGTTAVWHYGIMDMSWPFAAFFGIGLPSVAFLMVFIVLEGQDDYE